MNSSTKPIILTFVRHYLPGYKSGGPVRTIDNAVEQLGDELQFKIITSDRDAYDTTAYPNVCVNEWNRVGKADVFYCSSKWSTYRNLGQLIRRTDYDVLYLNSLFDPTFSIVPLLSMRIGLLLNKPVILAPRGELSSGALGLKAAKKGIFIAVSKIFGLYRDVIWQASSALESEEIKRAFSVQSRRVFIAPNFPCLIKKDNELNEHHKEPGYLKIIFLSRIAVKKNLAFALEVLKGINASVEFNIYGPVDDDTYWNYCQNASANIPHNVLVKYNGSIEHERIHTLLAQHHLLFLPTLGENYCHVILEALTVGTPVLISNRTPWRRLERIGVGWDLPLEDKEQFRHVIHHCAAMDFHGYHSISNKARLYAQSILYDKNILDQNRRLYYEVLFGNSCYNEFH